MTLPPGAHTVTIDTPSGPQTRDIQISAPYAVVALRSNMNGTAVAQTPYVEAPAKAVVEPVEKMGAKKKK